MAKAIKKTKSKYTDKQIAEWKKKSKKWDALGKKIAKFYPEDSEGYEGGDLCDIGEVAAMAFGWL